MKALITTAMVSILAIFQNIALAEQSLLLNLKYQSDTTVIREITFYGNNIDPNEWKIDDRFSIAIDAKTIEVPESIYSRLHHLRRSFSYDKLSGGIQQQESPEYTCLLGGPSRGVVLEARYLTYENFRIASSQMRPVFSLAENCLFNERYAPLTPAAREDARAVVELLNTLNFLFAEPHD